MAGFRSTLSRPFPRKPYLAQVASNVDAQTDPYWDNVEALWTFDEGADESASFKDAKSGGSVSNISNLIKVDKDVRLFGLRSARFGGVTPRYLQRNTTAPGNDDFCIEAWFRPETNDTHGIFGFQSSSSNINRCLISTFSSGGGGMVVRGMCQESGGSFQSADSVALIQPDEWTWAAFERSGNDLIMLVNDAAPVVSTYANRADIAGVDLKAGLVYTTSTNFYTDGFLGAARYTRGVARYTTGGEHRPPIGPFPRRGR